ncbi:MAG: hypothetical protein ACRDH5_14175, partial [bacterium]
MRAMMTVMLGMAASWPAVGIVAASCSAVSVEVSEDACGEVLAVSVTGDAQGVGCQGVLACVSASGTSNATNEGSDYS